MKLQRRGAPLVFITCATCHEKKEENSFSWRKRDGKRMTQCRACVAAKPAQARRAEAHHNRQRFET